MAAQVHRGKVLLGLGLCGALGMLALGLRADSRAGFPPDIEGVTISTHGIGRDWGSDVMRPTMLEIRDLGADWITIHPYAGIGEDGTVRFDEMDPKDPPRHFVRPIEMAHALGMKILIKPHLAYWGTRFRWRGDIVFEDEASWERFWASYHEWIVQLAAITRDADGFVVGTELDQTTSDTASWRAIIGDVRRVTDAPLTYATNWDNFERIAFWPDLDAIGIQAYFPLVDDGESTDEATLRASWAAWMRRIRRFSEARERPVLFTELGYNHSLDTARIPWSGQTSGENDSVAAEAVDLQALCTEIALDAVANEATVLGAFLWKWFPYPSPVGRNYRLATPRMRQVIKHAWDGDAP